MPATLYLHEVVQAWGTPNFAPALKQALATLDPAHLPLQQALSHSSYVAEGDRTILIQRVVDQGQLIEVKVGLFFSGIIAGCSCADDPTPVEAQPEYCELSLTLDKDTAATKVALCTS